MLLEKLKRVIQICSWRRTIHIVCCCNLFLLIASVLIQSVAFGQSEWPFQIQSTPFHFHSDAPLRDIDHIVAEIQDLPQKIADVLTIQPRVELIHVVIMGSDASFQRYMQHYFPKAPMRRALFIKDRGPGIVFAYRNAEMLVDLRHECTHALIQDRLPELPLWMDEGIAEYFEVTADRQFYHPAHAESIRWQTRLGYVPNISDLEKLNDVGQMGSNDYRDAWAWIHFLVHGNPKGKAVLHEYLHDMENGATAGLFSHRLQQAIPNWRDEFIDYFQALESGQSPLVQVISTQNTRLR